MSESQERPFDDDHHSDQAHERINKKALENSTSASDAAVPLPEHQTPPNEIPQDEVPNHETSHHETSHHEAPQSEIPREIQPLLASNDRILTAPEQDEPFAHAKYAFVAVFGIYLMYQFAGGALHSAMRSQSITMAAIAQGVGQVLFMLIPALFVMRYSPLRMEGLMRFGGEITLVQWCVGLLGVFGVQLFDAGFVVMQERMIPIIAPSFFEQLRHWSELVEQAYRDFFAGTTAWQALRALIIGAVVPAFAEEFLFRGLFQRSLEEVYSVRRAIAITAVIFGALHFNPLSLVPLMLIGAYLGFLAYYTQSLALPIVAHFLSNAIAIVALFAPQQNGELPPQSITLFQAFLVALLGIVILSLAFITILRQTPQVAIPKRGAEIAERNEV
ncbi:MAG: CPBP family intramembrane metalloprotease [Candidatus Kapaibacterium sp.]|nr:MAG: CPBP family intramembrane metalloprotease [Candidatus Kapabacteria bacterium]